MNRFHTIRRFAVIVTGLVGALLAFCAGAAPAALASVLGGDPHGRPGLVHAHALATGGMPGWEIALIAAGAALLATALVVTAHRMRAARRRVTVRAA